MSIYPSLNGVGRLRASAANSAPSLPSIKMMACTCALRSWPVAFCLWQWNLQLASRRRLMNTLLSNASLFMKGCVKLALAARGSHAAGFTQPLNVKRSILPTSPSWTRNILNLPLVNRQGCFLNDDLPRQCGPPDIFPSV